MLHSRPAFPAPRFPAPTFPAPRAIAVAAVAAVGRRAAGRRAATLAATLGVALCLAMALLAWAPPAGAQGGPARVIVAPVETREIADTTPIIARLVATRQSDVATRAAGVVAEVAFAVGERVEAGQVLIRLDDALARIQETNAMAAVAAAEASVEVARARARQIGQALQRAEGLRNSTAFSRGSFEDLQQQAAEATAEITRAEAQLGVAKAALSRALYDVEHSVLLAPFDGVVIQQMAQPGQYIDLGEAAASILDASTLEIEADLPVDLVSGIQPGRELAAAFDGGLSTTATVRTLLPVETTSTRTRTVRLSVMGQGLPAAVAATGRSVTLRVPISAPRMALTVPKDALVQARGAWMVFAVGEGAAEPRTVVLGQSAGERIEVLSGVGPDDHVVIRGNERLRPGQPIAPVLADGTPLDAAAKPEAGAGPETGAQGGSGTDPGAGSGPGAGAGAGTGTGGAAEPEPEPEAAAPAPGPGPAPASDRGSAASTPSAVASAVAGAVADASPRAAADRSAMR
ncbi:MAG: efflux RND transporter periplasmic adaptor subunit [Pseudomonadota bacterium]